MGCSFRHFVEGRGGVTEDDDDAEVLAVVKALEALPRPRDARPPLVAPLLERVPREGSTWLVSSSLPSSSSDRSRFITGVGDERRRGDGGFTSAIEEPAGDRSDMHPLLFSQTWVLLSLYRTKTPHDPHCKHGT